MVAAKPEKPWNNKTPKPDPARRLTLDPRNIGSVEKTGQGVEYVFDADRTMIDEVASQNDFRRLLDELKGKIGDAATSLFAKFGRELMERVAEVGEKNKDRAWEMIETCARQTGLPFPHVLQVYVELFTLCSRPLDKWAIVESHPGQMRLQQYSCNYLKAQQDAGLSTEGLPCKALCISAFEAASKRRNIPVKVELTRQLPKEKVCEFTFTPR